MLFPTVRSLFSRPLSAALAPALAATLCCAPALAAGPEGDTHAAVLPDREILSILLPMNKAEVEVSRFAAERAATPEVKAFANQMVAAHEQLSQELTRATRRANAHGTLTREQRRRAEAPLRDDGAADGVMTEDEAEEIREERAEVLEEVAEEQAELLEEAREERVTARAMWWTRPCSTCGKPATRWSGGRVNWAARPAASAAGCATASATAPPISPAGPTTP